jgi:hypothetical protein
MGGGFQELVFPAELDEIRRRRRRLGIVAEIPADASPSTSLGLVGLSLSGGGIRSASLCLGVVQHLARVGVLRHVDYLSTVSGGGYLGACVSSLLGDPEPDPDGKPASEPFPLRKHFGEPEPPVLQHLRNGSNYLKPAGALSKLRVPAIVLRGMVLSLVSVLPHVIACVLLTRLAYGQLFPALQTAGLDLDLIRTSRPLAAGVFLFFAISAFYPYVIAAFRARFDWRRRNLYDAAITGALALILILLVGWPLTSVVHFAIVSTQREAELKLAERLADLDGSWGVPLLIILGVAVFAARSKAVAKLARALVGALVGIVGAMLPLAMYLALCIWEIPPQRHVKEPPEPMVLALDNGTVPSAVRDQLEVLRPKGSSSSLDPIDVRKELPGRRWSVTASVDGRPTRYSVHRVHDGLFVQYVWLDDPGGQPLIAFALGLLLLNFLFLDVNDTSLHGFYRDRLSRVFVVGLRKGKVVLRDRLKLSELNAASNPSAVAPYHLVNATLNLAGSNDPNLRGRNADFFLFSKCFVGSEQTGYVATPTIERADPHLDLATAMAISAAAAAPQMGAMAVREFSALLTLVNARMGYWLPNPKTFARKGERRRTYRWALRGPQGNFVGPGTRYLLKEATGNVDENGYFVNVSDGGHLENLGMYELLRRRCRLVVAVDGEQDLALEFGSLVTVMRYAWIDMGVRVEIDLAPMRSGARAWALGRIHYAEGEDGVLLYVKARLTGDEGEVIKDYHRRHADFPHQTTADQFFDETQLEAYRALGDHIARSVLHTHATPPEALDDLLTELFEMDDNAKAPRALTT